MSDTDDILATSASDASSVTTVPTALEGSQVWSGADLDEDDFTLELSNQELLELNNALSGFKSE